MYQRWVVVTAASYVVLHHLGLVHGGFGAGPDDTQWVDWLDLLVPFLVLGPAAAALHVAGAPPRTWWTFGVGAITYATGHGVHLAANSVGNADPGPTAHLWDEVVGHYVWYAGVALVVVALAETMVGRPRPPAAAYLLAVLVGLTWASNAVGGGTEVFSLVLAIVGAAYGWRQRHGLGGVLLAAGSVAVVSLIGSLVVSAS